MKESEPIHKADRLTAEEFFRDKIKQLQPNKEVITLANEMITAEQGMRWAHEFKKLTFYQDTEPTVATTSTTPNCICPESAEITKLKAELFAKDALLKAADDIIASLTNNLNYTYGSDVQKLIETYKTLKQ